MATKLLNVRMEQEMIDELKKVCGELDISVTDAIKHFSTKLIEERTLAPTNGDKNSKEIIDDMNWEKTLLEDWEDSDDVNYDPEKFEKTFEEISNIVLFYYRNFNKMISENPYTCCEKPYEYFIQRFEKEYGERLKDEIIKKLTDFCKLKYDEWRSSYYEMWEMGENLRKGKMLETMNNLRKENPNLFKELVGKYSYDIPYSLMFVLDCHTYEEAKEKLESSLTPEEIKVYLEYENYPKENIATFKEAIKKDENKYQLLIKAHEKIQAFSKETMRKIQEKNEKEIREREGLSDDEEIEYDITPLDLNTKLKDLKKEKKSEEKKSEKESNIVKEQ